MASLWVRDSNQSWLFTIAFIDTRNLARSSQPSPKCRSPFPPRSILFSPLRSITLNVCSLSGKPGLRFCRLILAVIDKHRVESAARMSKPLLLAFFLSFSTAAYSEFVLRPKGKIFTPWLIFSMPVPSVILLNDLFRSSYKHWDIETVTRDRINFKMCFQWS